MDFEKELSEIYPWMLCIARKFCKSIQDAEDLAGDTVCKVLTSRDKFDTSKSLKTGVMPLCRIPTSPNITETPSYVLLNMIRSQKAHPMSVRLIWLCLMMSCLLSVDVLKSHVVWIAWYIALKDTLMMR